ncbi:MAG TPA: hypothetical protein VGM86_32350 [Thermoanaerobaculia bacterium]|jgi:hypothetical protein
MFHRAKILCASIAIAFGFALLSNQNVIADEILRNQDVLKMISAGLSEEVIVAKIREAPQVDFQLSIDDLVALRKAGVSDRVVGAMLGRSHPAATVPGSSKTNISLKTAEGTFPLKMGTGKVSSAGFGWTSNVFMNYPDLRASVRTHDKRPTLLVTCPSALEAGQYYFAIFNVDKRNEVRSLKLGQAIRKNSTPGGRLAPDKDWVLPFDVQEDSPGTWRVTLKNDLKPGEYGWYINLPDTDDPYFILKQQHNCFVGGTAFDFGVD